jgi:tRNA-specific 2-thiouridylase
MGKPKEKQRKIVLLGLSGGVDSSVSAILLKKQGYKVIGAFMKCFSDTKDPITGECGWIKEKQMAQKIASKLKIPFITLDLEKQYKSQVILPMIKGYRNGKTPNPDIACNTIIKFPWLIEEAKKRNIPFVATGHYARIKNKGKEYILLKGKDKNKDQSYFLYELDQSILSKTLFPIGHLKKEEVRKIAKKNKLPNYNKHGTSGICFVGNVNIKSFLEKSIKHHEGEVKDTNKNTIGTHPGIFYYTIGQRAHEGIGIRFKKPKEDNKRWFIADKISPNTLIIAPEGDKALKKSKIIIKSLHLINPNDKIPINLKARIRHLGDLLDGKLIKQGKGYQFTLKSPVLGIAEGQHIVLYNKNNVIGGGEISL